VPARGACCAPPRYRDHPGGIRGTVTTRDSSGDGGQRGRATSSGMWPGFGPKFDAQGVLARSMDASKCIGYLTKYLTKAAAWGVD
jgi:hypothetical protein